MRIEEQYPDVLQNLELAIVTCYREHPEIYDSDVQWALDAVAEHYQAGKLGRAPRELPLSPRQCELRDGIRHFADWRLGRLALRQEGTGAAVAAPAPLPLADLLLCLKRLQKSVRTWSKRSGPRGYLTFASQFVP